MLEYKKHHLSRVLTVQEIESADYVRGIRPSTYSHMHQEAWELCVCLTGSTVVVCESKRFVLSANQFLLIQPGKAHYVSVYNEDSSAFVISFTCTNGGNLFPLLGSNLCVDKNQTDLFQQIIRELDLAFEKKDHDLHLFRFDPTGDAPFGAEHAICCYLELVLLSFLRSVTMDQGQIVRASRFNDALNTYLSDQISQYIDSHLGEHLTVESIAKHFHYSRGRLSTIYKGVTGAGINETINTRRIQKAKVLLLKKELSITQIAEELGFSSSTYFTHKFTKTVGMSPTKFALLAFSSTDTIT